MHISAWQALALLSRAYAQKVDKIQESNLATNYTRTRNQYGKGYVYIEAITALVKLIYLALIEQERKVFRYYLKQAARWYKVVQALGQSSLLLIPHEEISNQQLERNLYVVQFNLFLELVKRERPKIYVVSKTLKAQLSLDSIASALISNKQRLSIKVEVPSTINKVEDIADSEDKGTDNIEDVSHSLVSSTSIILPLLLCQMTLLELFYPITCSR